MSKIRLLCLIALIAPGAAQAQKPLTLQDCIALARKQGIEYKSMVRGLEQGFEQLRQAQAAYAFNANLSMTVPQYSDSRGLLNSEALSTRVRNESLSLNYSGSIAMTQQVKHLGSFSLSVGGNRSDFSSNRRDAFVDFAGNANLSFNRTLLQELPTEINLRQSEIQLDIARLQFQRSDLQLEASVTDAYHNMVQSIRQYDIEEQSFAQSKAALELAQRKFQVGLIAEVEALRLQVDLLQAEARYAQAQRAIDQARDNFRQIMGMDLDEPFELVIDDEVDYVRYAISMEKAIEVGMRQNPDLRILTLQEVTQAIDVKQTRESLGPTANVNASIGFQGQGEEVGRVASNFERNVISAGVNVSVPLIDGGQRRSTLRQAELQHKESKIESEQRRQQILLQIRSTVEDVWQAERQIDILQAALDVAERTYEVELARFELGYTDSQQLLIAQQQLTLARTDALNAVIAYQRQLLNLRLVTMAELTQLVEDEPLTN